MNPSFIHPLRHTLLSLPLLFCATAQGANVAAELKKLSLDELLNVQVTTVSRQESKIGQSPAAIHVITQTDIRRSGVTTIPELLRRVPGLSVARVDANKWAISARGFNDRFANKLLVQMDGRTVYSPIFSGVFWDTMDYELADITDAALTDSRFNGFILKWDRSHRSLNSPSAFVQDQIAILKDRLSVVAGTKVEHNDLTGFEVQPTFRVLRRSV